MSEHGLSKNRKTFSKEAPDTAGILKKMQYQLDAIERKIDSLVKPSGPRDFKSAFPSKPRRESTDAKYPSKQKHAKRKEAASSEGKFYHGLPSGGKKGSRKKAK